MGPQLQLSSVHSCVAACMEHLMRTPLRHWHLLASLQPPLLLHHHSYSLLPVAVVVGPQGLWVAAALLRARHQRT